VNASTGPGWVQCMHLHLICWSNPKITSFDDKNATLDTHTHTNTHSLALSLSYTQTNKLSLSLSLSLTHTHKYIFVRVCVSINIQKISLKPILKDIYIYTMCISQDPCSFKYHSLNLNKLGQKVLYIHLVHNLSLSLSLSLSLHTHMYEGNPY